MARSKSRAGTGRDLLKSAGGHSVPSGYSGPAAILRTIPVPSPTPPSVLFATPPAASSTGADDQGGSDISISIEPTSYPTSTPYPTATPYPTPTPYPTTVPQPAIGSVESQAPSPATETAPGPTPEATRPINFVIPKKSDIKYPKVGSILDSLIAKVEAGEISAEEAAKEAPIHRGDSMGVTILLSSNVDGVVRFPSREWWRQYKRGERLHRGLRAGLAAGGNVPAAGGPCGSVPFSPRARPRGPLKSSGTAQVSTPPRRGTMRATRDGASRWA